MTKLDIDIAATANSLRHWQRMRDDPECGEKPIPEDCALCVLYTRDRLRVCKGCPIEVQTGIGGCDCSPFGNANFAWEAWDEDPCEKTWAAWQKAADAEIRFLKQLLADLEAEVAKKETANA